jgi:hypothetical protein
MEVSQMAERITITIQSTSGQITEQFNANQPVHAVKREAMAKLHIDPSQAGSYRLVLNGNELDENKTLGEVGVPNGATLLLVLVGAVVV